MSLPHIILGMLHQQARSGYDLNKELETTIHYFWDADISRIYRSLRQMEMNGWVEHQTVVQEEHPNKKVYSLTELGQQELKNWLAQPGKAPGTRNPFLAQLHFSGAIPIKAQLRVLEQHLESLRADLLELKTRAEAIGLQIQLPTNALGEGISRGLLSLEYGIRRYQFEIEWTESVIEMLRNAHERKA
jgi:DNA-binding PadR family transcriptional regulator